MTCSKMGFKMIRAGSRWLTAAMILGLLLFAGIFSGCNEGSDFDADLLFSLEDYAGDNDYAATYIDMMNRWYQSMDDAKSHLSGNVSGIPFTEAIPEGWHPITESELFYDQLQFEDDWYFTSFQDASYELIRFDAGVPEDIPYHPAMVEFGRLKYRNTMGVSQLIGDIVSLAYTDDYLNRSTCAGRAFYGGVDVLYFTQGGGTLVNYPAGMGNEWYGTIVDVSSQLNNPAATFQINGTTTIVRIDTQDQVEQTISGEAVIRSNGRGTGNVIVNGIERARIVFESFDTEFHGYVTVLGSDFNERLAF